MFKFIYNILTLGMYRRLESLQNEIIKSSSLSSRELEDKISDSVSELEDKISDLESDLESKVSDAVSDNIDDAVSNSFSPSDYNLLDECDIDQRIDDAKDDMRSDLESILEEEIENFHAVGEGKSFTIVRKE